MAELTSRIAGLSPEKQALLALRLKKKQEEAPRPAAIPRRPDLQDYPLSYAQQRLWFLDQFEPDSPLYNIPVALRLTGNLDIPALKRSLEEVVKRHEVLRATFGTEKGYPVQQVASQIVLEAPIIDLRGLPAEAREQEALRLAAEEARRPFNLSRGPLFRGSLLWLEDREALALFTLHHIAADGWSIGVLVREFGWLYAAITRGLADPGSPPLLPPLPIQYADYAAWQRSWLDAPVHDGGPSLMQVQLDYWIKRLRDAPVLDLPTDHPRPPVQTFEGACYSLDLPQKLFKELSQLGRQENATPFMTLLAAFKVLLHRYTSMEDLVVGIPIANRSRPEVEGLIGFFVNTLALRSDFSGSPSFRTFLGRVRSAALEAYAHQDLPFEMVVEALKLERDLSRTPVFQVMFDLQKDPLEALELVDLQARLVVQEKGLSKFDLSLTLTERANRLEAYFEYNRDLFERATIERMAGHFQQLLEGICAEPDRPVTELPLLTESERRQLLVEWNNTAADYPRQATLDELFTAQAARTPELLAIVDEMVTQTYAGLNRRANQLAHRLRACGVGPEAIVAIFMERSTELVTAMLGVIKAGGAYAPLDPDFPPGRLTLMLEDLAGPDRTAPAGVDSRIGRPVLLTQAHLLDRLPDERKLLQDWEVICLEPGWESLAGQPETNPERAAGPENLAYVLFTSGSTGRPKAVCCQHRGVINLLDDFQHRAPLVAGEACSWWTSPNFDVSVYEIFSALLSGGTLHIVPERLRGDVHRMIAWLDHHAIHSAYLPPFMLADYAAWVKSTQELPTLRRLLVGVEPISEPLLARIMDRLPSLIILNGYGPTEATVCCTLYPVPAGPALERNAPIGKPLQNTQIFLLDQHLQPVPVGVIGEVYVGGDGLARGYLNRPEQTAERFVELRIAPLSTTGDGLLTSNPQSAIRDLHRLYRTGDLARFLPDANLQFMGRSDFQMKVRGFRIELGEIETAIKRHPAVKDVIVVPQEMAPGEQRLVAYIVKMDPSGEVSKSASGQGGDLDSLLADELREFLKLSLPGYMLPAAFVVLPYLPLTRSGKLDRKALPPTELEKSGSRRPFLAPRNPLEAYLASLWEEILGVTRIGVYDNFFDLGGDSLRAAVLINRLREELREDSQVKAIFLTPTVAELAMYLSEHYPLAVARLENDQKVELASTGRIQSKGMRLGVVDLAHFQALVHPLPARPVSGQKNPPAVFILAPPRSGSTLLRVMLAGHPRLFAPPELELLSFNTLQERRKALEGERSYWLQGAIRAVMEARACSAAEAQRIMQTFEARDMCVRDFYRTLQGWIGDRLLIDKTPTYALDPAILQRAESDFADACFIHLVRHPYATIYSFLEARLDGMFFRYPHDFSRRELAELVWTASHQNICAFLTQVPAGRQIQLSYEALVQHPENVMQQLCQFLGIEYLPALVQPYQGARMTDGVQPGDRAVGDQKFYMQKKINPASVGRWVKYLSMDFLGEHGWQIAERLGYTRGAEAPAHPGRFDESWKLDPIRRVTRSTEAALPLSFAQQRLWFLDQLEPGSAFYNIPVALRLTGALNRPALEQALGEIVRRHEVLRTTFPTVAGKPELFIAPDLRVPFPLVDLRNLSVAERELTVQRLLREEARRPFDLSFGPLLRVLLLRLAEEEHIVLLTLHHIIADGWSAGVMVREMAVLYKAFLYGQPEDPGGSLLPELPIQYVDYAAWQRKWLASAQAGEGAGYNETGLDEAVVSRGPVSPLGRQLEYWKKQFEGMPPLLELPTDRPRSAVKTYNGAIRWFELPPILSARLKEFGQGEGATLFMTLLAAFQALLHRYTGQDDFGVGTPVANRGRAELEALIGFFVNTLVLRADLSGEPSFRELVRRVREVALAAYECQEIPFEMLVDALQPERNLSHAPLFQVMFTLQDSPIEAARLNGLALNPLYTDTGTAKFDLTLSMVERSGQLMGALEYSVDLFDDSTIQRLLKHFHRLLEEVVADPDRPVVRLSILADDERRHLLYEWNKTQQPAPLERCAHQLFEAQVERTPEAVAVTLAGESLTYNELNRRANQLARVLHRQGIGPDARVGLCVERSFEMLLGILAILKAGGAWVPLDPRFPVERLAFIAADARLSLVLTQGKLLPALTASVPSEEDAAKTGIQFICLDDDWPAISSESDGNLPNSAGPDNLAYVIYTSGSTGQPKGVEVEHHGLVNLATAFATDFEVGAGSRVLQFFSISFDGSVAEIFTALLSGAALILAPAEMELPGPELARLLREERVSVIVMVASALTALAACVPDPRIELPDLAVVVQGGEVCSTEVAAHWGPGHRFYNAYGPTEASVAASFYRVEKLGLEGASLPIGRPLANTRLYILDPHQQPTPVGVVGELYIGGAGVARGYLNRPELTAERFVEMQIAPLSTTPLNTTGGESQAAQTRSAICNLQRVYRTGDLCRYRPDGNIEYLGRTDQQVKVRGFRIELGEIEAALQTHPAVREAAVLAHEAATGGKRLIAYIAMGDAALGKGAREGHLSAGDLRTYLQERLPYYMIPTGFELLERLPHTSSGKIDRRALAAHPGQTALDEAQAGQDNPGPRSEAEAILVQVWKSVLGVQHVSVQDNFFELGGDSILSIQVIARAGQAGLRLTPRQLFKHPTIAELAAVAGRGAAVQAEQGLVQGSLPLTPIQRWFFEQELPERHYWNQSLLLEVPARLEPDRLEEAVARLLAHHDALRLRFRQAEAGWEGYHSGLAGPSPFVPVDLTNLPAEEQPRTVERLSAKLQGSLNLEAGPLLRVAYFDLGPDRPGRLLLIAHHLVIDAVSWRILLDDLGKLYTQRLVGDVGQLPPKTTSFKYWAMKLSEFARSEAVTSQLPYWLALAEDEPPRLPVDQPAGDNLEGNAQNARVYLEATETQVLLTEAPRVYQAEINAILLFALAEAFSGWTGQDELLVDLEGHGREDLFEDVDLSRTVGWFTSLYPLRLKIEGDRPDICLDSIKGQLSRVPQKGIGYGLLRFLSTDPAVHQALAGLPRPQVSFNYLGQTNTIQADDPALGFALAREWPGPAQSRTGQRSHEWAINGSVLDGRLQFEWTYSSARWRQETVERVAQGFVRALRGLITFGRLGEPGRYRPSDFPEADLTQDELETLLTEIAGD